MIGVDPRHGPGPLLSAMMGRGTIEAAVPQRAKYNTTPGLSEFLEAVSSVILRIVKLLVLLLLLLSLLLSSYSPFETSFLSIHTSNPTPPTPPTLPTLPTHRPISVTHKAQPLGVSRSDRQRLSGVGG